MKKNSMNIKGLIIAGVLIALGAVITFTASKNDRCPASSAPIQVEATK